ncbi:MAG: aromatic amino acid transport family protein [Chlamydiales bacterium]|nr:aromatic amino acid transport family protein [Chlamydiales bacterium]
MKEKNIQKSRVLGAILLVAGNCIGAGMLALPVLTGPGGFTPAIIMFLLCWLFMTTTGLLLLEANLAIGENVSIITMAESTLGRAGKWIIWVVWALLFYSLLVAYVAASGALLASAIQAIIHVQVPDFLGSLIFVLFFGFLVYLGTQAVDYFNRFLMIGLVISYVCLISFGALDVKYELLERSEWSYTFFMLPILIISFGFHNIVPSLVPYLKGHARSLKWTLYAGSAIPLCIYLIWEWMVLGIVPVNGANGLVEALEKGSSATDALKSILGNSWIASMAEYFAVFALITSFLAVALSFVHFLADALKVKSQKRESKVLCALVFVPPFIFAVISPHVFLTALNYAGGVAVILFGIMPALMTWVLRYHKKSTHAILVPGGRFLLVIIILFATGVFLLELSSELGLLDTLKAWSLENVR